MNNGYIKLYRKSIESAVFQDPELWKLWCLCLLKANYKHCFAVVDGIKEPIELQPGQFVTGRFSLHRDYYPRKKQNQKSPITLWRWMEILENLENLNIKTNNKYSIITIVNWDRYQSGEIEDEQQNEQQMNNRRTTDEQQMITDKKDKKDKKKDIERPSDPRVRVFIDWWYGMYQRKFKRKYAISNGAKIGAQIKALLKSGLTFRELQISAMQFLLDEDPFIVGDGDGNKGAGHEIGVFMSRLNKYDHTDQSFIQRYDKFIVDETGKGIQA